MNTRSTVEKSKENRSAPTEKTIRPTLHDVTFKTTRLQEMIDW